jgi:hypothetical protein
LLFVRRRAQRKVESKQGRSIEPYHGAQLETFEESPSRMVMNFGQQFNLRRSGDFDGGIVENKHGFAIFAGQTVNEFMNAKG